MAEITIPNGFKPRPYQREAMRHYDRGGRFGVYCWPRRSGKDLTFLHQTIKAAHERVGMYYHMLPTHKHARKVIWDALDNDGKRIIDTAIPPALRESTNETEMKVKLKCGSLWQLVGADYYDSLVGSNPVGIVISEAALTDPRAWSFFRPIIAANGGWVAFVSTPRGYNWFHDTLETAKKGHGWHWSHLNCHDTGHIGQDILDAERREMPDELYRQEYDTSFSAANVGAIFGKYVEAAETEGRICTLEPYRPGDEIWVTSDIGVRDKAAWIAFRILRGGFEVIAYDEATGLDAGDWIERLRRTMPPIDVLVLPHDARARSFQSKYTTVDQFLHGGIAREVRVNAQRKKQDSINAGRMLFRNTRIGVECVDLLSALRAYSYDYDEETRTFSAQPRHDWASHAADAWQEAGACLAALQPQPKPVAPIIPSLHRTFTLDQLHATVGPSRSTGRI